MTSPRIPARVELDLRVTGQTALSKSSSKVELEKNMSGKAFTGET
jgi:hypothetical protein